MPRRALLAIAACVACETERAAPTPIRFLHTFGAAETELFGLAAPPAMVEPALAAAVHGDATPDDIEGLLRGWARIAGRPPQ